MCWKFKKLFQLYSVIININLPSPHPCFSTLGSSVSVFWAKLRMSASKMWLSLFSQ